MAYNNADEIFVASNGQIYVAPVGTALPTTPTGTLNSAFVGLGFVTEEGVSLSVTPEIKEILAWQSRQAVRRDLTKQEIQASFQLQQWDEDTVPLAFGGGEISALGGGGYRYDFPVEEDALTSYSMVIDAQDGDVHTRIVLASGNPTDNVETKFARSDPAVLPITFKALEPSTGGPAAYILTDSAAYASGS